MRTEVCMASTTSELSSRIDDIVNSVSETELVIDIDITPIVKSETKEKVLTDFNGNLIRSTTTYNYIFMATVYIDSEAI